MRSLSIIVPVLDEADGVVGALTALTPLREHGVEVIVVDGGSRDQTVEVARAFADRVIAAPRGRGAQMNAGAVLARSDTLLFLHADTLLPPNADALVHEALRTRAWGRFDVRIAGRNPLLALVAAFMNARSRLTGIATGDQAVFLTRSAFAAAGGFPDIPLMEDVALCKRLKRIGRPACLSARVVTSGRRFEARGVIRTMLLMGRLRLSFWLGAEPARLARRYGYVPRNG